MAPPPDDHAPADATVVRPPVAPPPPAADDYGRTMTAGGWRAAAAAGFHTATYRADRPVPAGSGSGPPSGQAIRDLDHWVEINRERIDVGEYKLLRSIGTGAFGSVWEAHNFDTGEHVAIKFLSAGDDRWEAMLGEVKFLQALEGTHGIVTVKQVRRGTDEQPPYYVMPLANNRSLADRVKEAKEKAAPAGSGHAGPVVPVAEAVRVFTRVAEALAAVHRRGIHHCDLKPRNVLLHQPDPGHPPQPLIADFGQAHLATDDTPALGTFFYMPPDQADAALKKARSDSSWDVYALGALLYELLVGEPPRREESLLRTIRRTEHLETKLAAYRDGVHAAATPTAHKKLVDPLLADVIDRCLSTEPARRPRDAGEVVDLLKKRAWWRQVRGPLAVGAAATLVFVLLVASISAYAANTVYKQTTAEVGNEIDGSLTRTAWYGRGAVERTLQRHVAFVEERARVGPDLLARLTAAADAAAAAGTDPDRVYDAAGGDRDRGAFDELVTSVHAEAQNRWPGDEGRTVALLVVVGDTPAGGAPARGYTLARAGGKQPPRQDREDPRQRRNYRTDWSFRDYFTAAGNRFDEQGRPHPVVRRTHISQTYQSRRDGSWRLDVVTPVWAADGRVVALLSVGLDVNRHLRQLIDMPDELLADRQEIAKALDAFVVNDRGSWVWHEDGMAGLEADARREVHRDPEHLTALARELAPAHDRDPDDLVPWKSAADGIADGPDRYVDPVAVAAGHPPSLLLAHTLTFRPYQFSRYEGIRPKTWGFVAQVPEDVALAPVLRLKRQLVWAGSILVGTLAGLAVVLWVWLFRLLRGWEFAGHG